MSDARDSLFSRAHAQYERGELRSAFRLFLSGAKAGDSGAQHMLGYFYDAGIGVKRRRESALYWYKRAYRRGQRISAANIGTVYRDEGAVREALAWFRRAVRLRDADAYLEIARLLIGERRKKEAKAALQRAVRARSSDITRSGREKAERLLKRLA